MSVLSSRFSGNLATSGGAVFVTGGSVPSPAASLGVLSTVFVENIAVDQGGAVAVRNASRLSLEASTFARNVAARGGAVATNLSRAVLIRDVSATSNAALLTGGVFYLSNFTSIAALSSAFAHNRASAGGLAFLCDAVAVPRCFQPDASGPPGGQLCSLENNTASRRVTRHTARLPGAAPEGGLGD